MMICPFRIDVEYEYVALVSSKENEDPSYLEKAQRQKYPECISEDCPFFSYGGGCDRVKALMDD